MRRHITIIALLLVTATAFGGTRISDYSGRTLSAVLKNDGSLIDAALKEAVESNWNITSYDFCGYDVFEKAKGDTTRLFLMVYSDDNATPATYLALYKGGKDLAEKGLVKPLFELPLGSSGNGREDGAAFMSLYVRAFQNRVRDWSTTLSGVMPHSGEIDEMKKAVVSKICFAKEDYDENISDEGLAKTFGDRAESVTTDKLDSLAAGTEDILLARSVYIVGDRGSKCRNMIFELRTGTLRYLDTVQLIFGRKKGFSRRELKNISYDYR